MCHSNFFKCVSLLFHSFVHRRSDINFLLIHPEANCDWNDHFHRKLPSSPHMINESQWKRKSLDKPQVYLEILWCEIVQVLHKKKTITLRLALHCTYAAVIIPRFLVYLPRSFYVFDEEFFTLSSGEWLPTCNTTFLILYQMFKVLKIFFKSLKRKRRNQ